MISAIEKDFWRRAADSLRQLRRHLLDQLREAACVEAAQVVRAAQNPQQLGLGDFVFFGRDRDNLLRRDIQASAGNHDLIQMPTANRAHRGRAFEQIVGGHREKSALRRRAEAMARAPDALNRGRDRFRRIDLAHQLDRADIDTKFKRRGRDDRAQLAALEPLLGQHAFLARKAAVMRHHGVGADSFLQVDRNAFGPPARERED